MVTLSRPVSFNPKFAKRPLSRIINDLPTAKMAPKFVNPVCCNCQVELTNRMAKFKTLGKWRCMECENKR